LFSSNTDSTSPAPGAADEANEQLNVNGVGDPTVVLAAVGLKGIPPTHRYHRHTSHTTHPLLRNWWYQSAANIRWPKTIYHLKAVFINCMLLFSVKNS